MKTPLLVTPLPPALVQRIRNRSLSLPLLQSIRTFEPPPLSLPPHGSGVTNRFKVQVIDARTKRVVSERPWQPNLILDQGLNQVCGGGNTDGIPQRTQVCCVGTGTTPTEFDSGATTGTAAGTNLNSSAPFFTVGMVGMLVKMDSGEERYITAFVDASNVTLNATLTAGPTPFTVWAVNQTSLAAETKRTNTYLTGAGNCGTSIVSNVAVWKRTFDFSVEVANQNYTELGWSFDISAGANLFSRALIAGGTVSVLIGQQLRVIYEVTGTFVPTASTPLTPVITGWPVAPATNTDGDYRLTNIMNAIAQVQTSGGNSNGDSSMPNLAANWRLGTGATLPAFGADYSPGTQSISSTTGLAAYVSGSFQRIKTASWSLGNGNRTDWRGVDLFAGVGPSIITFIFDQAQTKTNTNTLTLNWPQYMRRILTNP